MSKFTVPTDDDYTRLAQQWMSVVALVQEEYGATLDQDVEGLDLIQRVLDDRLLDPDNTYGLQCLGVAFGRILAKCVDELDWWSVEDEYGRDPCLRYLETSLHVNPLTMISKRIESGSEVNVRRLFENTREFVEENSHEVS